VARHLSYLDRGGELDIETDDGQQLSGKSVEQRLLEDWNLDLEQCRRRADLQPRPGRSQPKLVHKVLFSMPPGTPPQKVLEAVKGFAREEFALKHRYAMVLHTDEPHPHVHMVVKAVSEDGVRLNIRKATLRHWRAQFARHLRALGIAANATDRAVRGQIKTHRTDRIYRPECRGASTRTRGRVQAIALELTQGQLQLEPGKHKLQQTRGQVESGWRAVGELLLTQGERGLAADVMRFVGRMPPPWTDKEQVARELIAHVREQQRASEPLVR
jgi:hypothetical protein